MRAYAAEILQELGYHVIEACNGVAALEVLEGDEHIDLLLSDVVMPGGVNGRQLADEAVLRRPDLKVLFMTGYARNAILDRGHFDGVQMIGKPFSFDELADKVRKRLDAWL